MSALNVMIRFMHPLRSRLVGSLCVTATWFGLAAAQGQGTILFQNIGGGIANPVPVTGPTGAKLGSGYAADLLVGSSPSGLAPVGITAVFGEGQLAGYFGLGQPPRSIPGFPAGAQPYMKVRVWEMAGGPTYETALARAESPVFKLGAPLGGGLLPAPALVGFSWPSALAPVRFGITPQKALQIEGESFELRIDFPADYAPVIDNWYKDGTALFAGPLAPEVLRFQNATRAQSGTYMAKGHRALMPDPFETESAKVVVIPRIILTVSRRQDGAFGVELDSGSEARYTLQFKSVLAGSAWTAVASVVGTGSIIQLVHTNALSGQGFYRVEASLPD